MVAPIGATNTRVRWCVDIDHTEALSHTTSQFGISSLQCRNGKIHFQCLIPTDLSPLNYHIKSWRGPESCRLHRDCREIRAWKTENILGWRKCLVIWYTFSSLDALVYHTVSPPMNRYRYTGHKQSICNCLCLNQIGASKQSQLYAKWGVTCGIPWSIYLFAFPLPGLSFKKFLTS